MNKICFGLILATFIPTQAFPGQEVGNGGNAVICGSNPPELLDIVEAKQINLTAFTSVLPAKDAVTLVTIEINRLMKLDPVFSKRITEVFRSYAKNFKFLPSSDLTAVSDSLHVALPKGCTLKQAAIRKHDAAPDEARFLIDQDLWNQLELRSQAGLIFHELIYNDMIANGATDSRQARKLNALIQSDRFFTMKPADYIREAITLSELHTTFNIGGVEYLTGGNKKLELYPDGSVKSGFLSGKTLEIDVKGNHYSFSNPNGPLKVEFHKNGIPVSGWLNQPTRVSIGGHALILEYLVQFKESGEILKASKVDEKGANEEPFPNHS
jgi:hypothetical protein